MCSVKRGARIRFTTKPLQDETTLIVRGRVLVEDLCGACELRQRGRKVSFLNLLNPD